MASFGDSNQMDLLYATTPMCEATFVTLHREPMMRYHVEDHNDTMSEVLYEEFGNHYLDQFIHG